MNHWPFIIAAYVLTIIATTVIVGWSYVAMRRAETAVENLKGDQ
jgi:hypothetical protein